MRNRLLLLGGALAAFGASLFSGFHFDDYAIFSDRVLTSSTGWMAVWARTAPLTDLTYWLNYLAGGVDPLGYHLLNLALYLGAVALAYACLRRLLPERAALAAAAVFALHPIQAEAANYVSARGAILGALFCFASLAAWLDGRRWSAVAWYVPALLANPYCAAFPALLAVIRWGEPESVAGVKEVKPPALPHWLAMVGLSLAALGREIYALHGAHGLMAPWKYFLAQGPAIWRYLRLVVVPYGFTVDPDVPVPAIWAGALAWVVLLLAAARIWKAGKGSWSMWVLGGLALLVPSSSLLPSPDAAADPRMYLPMFCFAAAIGLLLTRVRTQALAATAVAGLTLLSVVRTTVWMSDHRLWKEAVTRAPEKVRPKVQLARALPASDALELLERAQNAAPHAPAIPAEMAAIYIREEQADPALMAIGRAITLDPNNAEYYNTRGVAFGMSGLPEAARADFERALAIDPNLTAARENLAKIPPAQ